MILFLQVISLIAGSSSPVYPNIPNTNDSPCTIFIEAKDLTEDLSDFSTQNDEILFLLYSQDDTTSPLILIATDFHIFQKDSMTYTLLIPRSEEFNNVILIIIELDTDKTIEQIDPVVRAHSNNIYKKYIEKDRIGMETYLGDDDLIGYHIISKKQLQKCNFSFISKGYQFMDRYEYG